MKRVLISAGLVWVGAAMLLAQSALPAKRPAAGTRARVRRPQSRRATASRRHRGPGPRSGGRASPADAPKYQALLNQYCVGCHNTRVTAARQRSGESRDRPVSTTCCRTRRRGSACCAS